MAAKWSELDRAAAKTKPDPDDRRAKYWDHENGCWKNLDEEAIEKLWPSKKGE